MAEFENFEGASEVSEDMQENNADEDPAAAFLAREQDQLAGLDDEGSETGGFTEPDAVTYDADADGEVPEDLNGDSGQPTGQPSDDFSYLDDAGYEGLSTDYSNLTTNGPSDAYSAISQVDQLRQEPEKIKIWREEQRERLEQKDADSEEKKLEWREIAKKELDDWYKNRSDQLQKSRETNRAAEQAFVQERDESIPGHEWERICRLCDFNPKNSKNSKDVSRMRSIILQLKQTPLVR